MIEDEKRAKELRQELEFLIECREPIDHNDYWWLPENDEKRIVDDKLARDAINLSRQSHNFSKNNNTKLPFRPAPRSRLWKFRVKRPQKSFSY